MVSRKQSIFRRMANILATGMVLAVFVIPVIVTGWWIVSGVNKHDPRKIVPASSFQVRPADRGAHSLHTFQEPVVSITFDDGWESAYTQAFPVLQRYGFHSTQYVITDEFNNNAYMSVDQLRAMLAAGTQIGGHTVTHADLTTLTAAELKHELKDSQDTLQQLFGGRVQDFTSPYGAYNTYTLHAIGTYYRSQKNAEGDAGPATNPLLTVNIAANFNPLNFSSFSVRHDTTLADIQRLLDEAAQRNGWIVLTYHQIDDSNEEYAVTPQAFAQQMELVGRSRLRSATVGQVMDALGMAQKAER
jgi:peptidoglycan/xylan/chitin deacetylase (PgdA/CDA1 family)